jgi:hypothetical protein
MGILGQGRKVSTGFIHDRWEELLFIDEHLG